MRAGSKAGAEVVNRYINYLGCGLTNFINVFQPEMLLIGGGVSKEGETLLDPLRKILAVETYGSDHGRTQNQNRRMHASQRRGHHRRGQSSSFI